VYLNRANRNSLKNWKKLRLGINSTWRDYVLK
jgi:hypothetical protein